MSWLGSLLGNEVHHIGNLFSDFSGKNAEQLLIGAADPLSSKIWGGITGQNFTPMVGQLGGETQAQYDEAAKQGVDVGPAETMGAIANAIAGYEAGGYFAGGSGFGTQLGGSITQGSEKLDGTQAEQGQTSALVTQLLGMYDQASGGSSASSQSGGAGALSDYGGLFKGVTGALGGSQGASGGSASGGGGGGSSGDTPDYFTSLFNFGPGTVKASDPITDPITLASPNYSAMLLNGIG